jgi:hypothetical protein
MKPLLNRQFLKSVLGCVAFFPVGMVALHYTGKADTRLKAGDSYTARLLVNKANVWSNVAFALGVLAWAVTALYVRG